MIEHSTYSKIHAFLRNHMKNHKAKGRRVSTLKLNSQGETPVEEAARRKLEAARRALEEKLEAMRNGRILPR